MRAKSKQSKYEKVGESAPTEGSYPPATAATITSYQDSAAVHYALPQNKKDVTYCVIDGRLVDDA
jgi:hypothetical protein